ncbi:MAG: TlyA family RNA methyltransferase [Crocinitomicaceae bacterium]|nr:TlyA family RNA methyltransferase [Flavobacteriales bacterium]NQZ37434.1 TlyA family RNA methyltransferase [Crocinitomicaceae bacterium]
MEEERLDKILIQRKLVSTRTRAERIIRETGVNVNGKLITKTGKRFPVDCEIEMLAEEIPWVSRGAIKLLAAIEKWNPTIKDGTFMDIGASTGGFTEVLLTNGASKVFCVDVGTKQLHQRIDSDERTVNLEQTHVRELLPKIIPEMNDGCVIDVSFISLEKIFPFIHSFLKEDSFVIALVKPQFEVGKKNIGKGGIVKDKKLYPTVIENIKRAGKLNNLTFIDLIDSPILGGDGNKEFLIYFKKTNA